MSHTAAAVHSIGRRYVNERASRRPIILITGAHNTERLTDYPAAHKGQPRSLPVEIIQFAGGFTAGVLCRPSCPKCTKSLRALRTVEKGGKKEFCLQ